MAYGPHTPADRRRMLTALGMENVDELFADIPPALRSSPLRLDPPESEQILMGRMSTMAGRNRVDLASFLGGGAYRHFSPPLVDQMLLRGEWHTAYAPYQPCADRDRAPSGDGSGHDPFRTAHRARPSAGRDRRRAKPEPPLAPRRGRLDSMFGLTIGRMSRLTGSSGRFDTQRAMGILRPHGRS